MGNKYLRETFRLITLSLLRPFYPLYTVKNTKNNPKAKSNPTTSTANIESGSTRRMKLFASMFRRNNRQSKGINKDDKGGSANDNEHTKTSSISSGNNNASSNSNTSNPPPPPLSNREYAFGFSALDKLLFPDPNPDPNVSANASANATEHNNSTNDKEEEEEEEEVFRMYHIDDVLTQYVHVLPPAYYTLKKNFPPELCHSSEDYSINDPGINSSLDTRTDTRTDTIDSIKDYISNTIIAECYQGKQFPMVLNKLTLAEYTAMIYRFSHSVHCNIYIQYRRNLLYRKLVLDICSTFSSTSCSDILLIYAEELNVNVEEDKTNPTPMSNPTFSSEQIKVLLSRIEACMTVYVSVFKNTDSVYMKMQEHFLDITSRYRSEEEDSEEGESEDESV